MSLKFGNVLTDPLFWLFAGFDLADFLITIIAPFDSAMFVSLSDGMQIIFSFVMVGLIGSSGWISFAEVATDLLPGIPFLTAFYPNYTLVYLYYKEKQN